MKRLAVALAALAVFALLAHEVLAQGVLADFDQDVTLYFAEHRSNWLSRLSLALSVSHQTVVVLAVTALVAAALAWRRRGDWALLLAVPTGMLANNGVKHLVGRARPLVENPLLQLETLSFPSGHAIAATLVYGALCLVLLAHARRPAPRAGAVAFAVAMAAVVAFSRVYLGVHYLSDVLAGICLGIGWLALWAEGLERWQRRRFR